MQITNESFPNTQCKHEVLALLDNFEFRPDAEVDGFYNLWLKNENGEFEKLNGMRWGTSVIDHTLERYGEEAGMQRLRWLIELDISVHAPLYNKLEEMAEKQGHPCSHEQQIEAIEEAFKQYDELVQEAKAVADKEKSGESENTK